MNITHQDKTIFKGLALLLVFLIGFAFYTDMSTQNTHIALYPEIITTMKRRDYQQALDIIAKYQARHLIFLYDDREEEVEQLKQDALASLERVQASKKREQARDQAYEELKKSEVQGNYYSIIPAAERFLDNLSDADADSRQDEVEQIRARFEKQKARDDAYDSVILAINYYSENEALSAIRTFLNNLDPTNTDVRTSEVERIKSKIETHQQERTKTFSELVEAYEQDNYQATADKALDYISYAPDHVKNEALDMYSEALVRWYIRTNDTTDLALQTHLTNYQRWVLQGPDETQAWAEGELEYGYEQVKLGHFNGALTTFKTVQAIHPHMSQVYRYLNGICWYGGLWGHATDELLAICEQAVELALTNNQLANYRDSRGVVRALRGDYEGAMADFEIFIEVYSASEDEEDQDLVAKRVKWVKLLKEKTNPFTEETLAELRRDG